MNTKRWICRHSILLLLTLFTLKATSYSMAKTTSDKDVSKFHGTLLHGRVYSTTSSSLAYTPVIQCVSGGVRYTTTADKYGGYSLGMPLLPDTEPSSLMQCHVVVTPEAQRDDRTVLQGIFHIEAQWKQDFYVRGEDVAPPVVLLDDETKDDESTSSSLITNVTKRLVSSFRDIEWIRQEVWKWKMVWLGILLTSFGIGMLWMEDKLYNASIQKAKQESKVKIAKHKLLRRKSSNNTSSKKQQRMVVVSDEKRLKKINIH